jgi:Domain of unknown function (DUF4259)
VGTWGPGTFDDDIACDWLEDLYDSDPIAFFVKCLDLQGEVYLEFLACVGVVCTAEVLHALICGPRKGLPEGVHQWIALHPKLPVMPLVPDAIASLRRVIGPDSEMQARWEDNEDDYEKWSAMMEGLLQRLEAVILRNA